MRNQGSGEEAVWLALERLGYDYRLDEMCAALGVVQMGPIREILAKYANVAQMYRERLLKIDAISLPHMAPEVDFMSWFVHVVEVGCRGAAPEAQSAVRGHVTARFGDFLGTKRAGRTSVAMPPHNRITEDEVDYVA